MIKKVTGFHLRNMLIKREWKDRRIVVNKELWKEMQLIAKTNKISLALMVDSLIEEFIANL